MDNINIIEKNKLEVEEKIGTDDYDKNKGVYLDINKGTIKIYKNMLKTLDSYSLITSLYLACTNGLELKPFDNSCLVWSKKLTVNQTITFDKNKKLKIDDSNYTHVSGYIYIHVNINEHNKDVFLFVLNWIKICLEELYPELKEGFIHIMCLRNQSNLLKQSKSFEMSDMFKKKI